MTPDNPLRAGARVRDPHGEACRVLRRHASLDFTAHRYQVQYADGTLADFDGPDLRIDWPEPETDEPDEQTMTAWVMGDELAQATDGCTVETDGVCPHGHPSWMRRLGRI